MYSEENISRLYYIEEFVSHNISDGIHTICIEVYDEVENNNTISKMVAIDTVVPTIDIISPINQSVVGHNVTINISFYDENMKIYYFEFLGSTYYTTYIRMFLDTGNYILKAYAEDYAGNIRIVKIYFVVDVDPPIIEDVSINNGTICIMNTSTIDTISFSVSETSTIIVYIDEEKIYEETQCGDVEISIQEILGHEYDLPEGEHILRIVVIDQYGNVAEYTRRFIVDLTPPEITIEGLLNNSEISEEVEVTIKAEDKYGIRDLEIMINDSPYAYMDVENSSYIEIHITIVGCGQHMVRIKSHDVAGNENEILYVLNIEGTQTENETSPRETKSYDILFPLAFIMIFAIGGIGAILRLRKKTNIEDEFIAHDLAL